MGCMIGEVGDIGHAGNGRHPGEYRSRQGELAVHMTWFSPYRPAAVTQFRWVTRSASLPVDDVHKARTGVNNLNLLPE